MTPWKNLCACLAAAMMLAGCGNGVDPHGEVARKSKRVLDSHIVEVVTEAVPDDYLAYLQSIGVSYVFGGATEMVLGQRAIFALGAETRSRLNGVFLALFFGGGALGSTLGAWMYAAHGWHATLALGTAFPALALTWQAAQYPAPRPARCSP